jgi:two-component system chemotaxis response regulator CheY
MSKKILIVDDALSVRVLARETLEPEGYEICDASDGAAALKAMETERYQLIITDHNMPNMCGIELVKRIRTGHSHKFTPVLMMTTERSEARKEEARNAGVKAWLTKPFTPDRLRDAVKKMVV